MIAKETIAEIAIQTVNDYQPERVILFGSVATGNTMILLTRNHSTKN